jgi:DNA-binding NtrC family response regulator
MARVLIIDDDVDFCSMMETVLRSAGHDPAVSSHPIIGAEEAMSGEYDVITLDMRVPDLDGADLTQLFSDLNLKTPVIVLSGHLTGEIRADLRKAGITRILQKPFKSAELLEIISELSASPA